MSQHVPGSKIDLAACHERALQIQVSANQGRPAECLEDATLRRRRSGKRAPYSSANPPRFRTIIGKMPCQRPDQIAIRIEAENFESRKAAPLEPLPVILHRSFL